MLVALNFMTSSHTLIFTSSNLTKVLIKAVYDENIFEGIYLNDTAVKETSSIKIQNISKR